jgi:hypothetical protein
MESLLRDYLANPSSPAEHTTVEFSFPTSSAFMVYTGDYTGGSQPRTNLYGTLNRSALSVHAALAPADLKESLKKQKSIGKTLIEHIQKADGMRYSFHNNWLSKDDGAHRFSYFCNDSTLNKGRAANEGAGMGHKRKMKPVYDCAGTIHVKFSVAKQTLELHYKHIPCHKTYEERAPPPRKNSKRRKIMEVFEPDKLVRQPKKIGRPKVEKPAKVPKPRGRPPKNRRATEPLPGSAEAASELSNDGLAPLLDFLGSTDPTISGGQEDPVMGGDDGADTDPPIYSAAKLNELKKQTRKKTTTPRQGPVRPPSLQVPGMMSGYLSGDLITWGPKTSNKRPREDEEISPPLAGADVAAGPLANIAQAAAEVEESTTDSTAGMSELELLKAKLAAAEARINRLESEKSAPKPNAGPPGWPPPPAPPTYGYPPPPQFSNMPYAHMHGGTSQGYGYPQPPQSQAQPTPPQAGKKAKPRQRAELRTIHYDPSLHNASKNARSVPRDLQLGEPFP